MGSMEHPLSRLEIFGSMKADGESYKSITESQNVDVIGGSGGGSGGSLLFFLQTLTLGNDSLLSSSGGHGGYPGGGGGGGGRVHFDWFNIATGDEYVPMAVVNGTILTRLKIQPSCHFFWIIFIYLMWFKTYREYFLKQNHAHGCWNSSRVDIVLLDFEDASYFLLMDCSSYSHFCLD